MEIRNGAVYPEGGQFAFLIAVDTQGQLLITQSFEIFLFLQ